MRLPVVEELYAVLDAAQEGVGNGQRFGGSRFHQPAGCQAPQRSQGRARAHFRELPAPHHQQQLDDELDLADATARELHVDAAIGSARSPALGLLAHLGMELAQALKYAVVEIAAVDEGRDQ